MGTRLGALTYSREAQKASALDGNLVKEPEPERTKKACLYHLRECFIFVNSFCVLVCNRQNEHMSCIVWFSIDVCAVTL
jgi:hypothetical protein